MVGIRKIQMTMKIGRINEEFESIIKQYGGFMIDGRDNCWIETQLVNGLSWVWCCFVEYRGV